MRRTTTLRALAAGAGAASVLLAAGPAFAAPYPPFNHDWAADYEAEGYGDVTCHASPVPGNQTAVYFDGGAWAGWLGDAEPIAVVLKVADDREDEHAWAGFGSAQDDGTIEGTVYSASGDGNLTHFLICKGEPVAAGDEDDEGDEGTSDDETQTDAPDEGSDDTADDDTAEDDGPSGPPVETEGPGSQSGPNMGLIGGAVLALAGAGAAGFAMRRREGDGQH